MSDAPETLGRTSAPSEASDDAGRPLGPGREPKWRGLLEWLGVFAIALVVFTLIRVFVVSPFLVPSGSMEPTILIGDQVFAQRVSAHLGDTPEIGDIVVFRNPVAASDHEILVKRVVARGGQTVDLIDGRVYVDGIAVEEPYVVGESLPLPTQAPGVSIDYPYVVPDGTLWMMGDNRENSSDSRYFGAVPTGNVVGTVFFRYWPFSRIGLM